MNVSNDDHSTALYPVYSRRNRSDTRTDRRTAIPVVEPFLSVPDFDSDRDFARVSLSLSGSNIVVGCGDNANQRCRDHEQEPNEDDPHVTRFSCYYRLLEKVLGLQWMCDVGHGNRVRRLDTCFELANCLPRALLK